MEPITTFLTTTIAGNLIMGIAGDTTAGKIQEIWDQLNLGNHDLQNALAQSYEATLSAIEVALTPSDTLRGFVTGLLAGDLLKAKGEKELGRDFSTNVLTPFLKHRKLSDKTADLFLHTARKACRLLLKKKDEIFRFDEILEDIRKTGKKDGDGSNRKESRLSNAAARETFCFIESILFTGQNLSMAPDLEKTCESAASVIFKRLENAAAHEIKTLFENTHLNSSIFFELLREQKLFMNGLVFNLEMSIKNNQKVANILQEYRSQKVLIENERVHAEERRQKIELKEKLEKLEQAVSLTQQAGLDATQLSQQITPLWEKLKQLDEIQERLESWEKAKKELSNFSNNFKNSFSAIIDKLSQLTQMVRKQDEKLDHIFSTTEETKDLADEALKIGDLSTAREAYSLALTLDPNHQGAKTALAKLADKGGNGVQTQTATPFTASSAEPLSADIDLSWTKWNERGKMEGTAPLTLKGILSINGTLLYSVGSDSRLKIWDTLTRKEIRSLDLKTGIQSFDLAETPKIFVCGHNDGNLRFWDLESGNIRKQIKCPGKFISRVVLTKDARFAITGHGDNSVRIWDSETAEELHTLCGHDAPIWALALSPDERYVVSSGGKTAIAWNFMNGKEVRKFIGHTQPIGAVVFSQNGKSLASGGGDGLAFVWDFSSGQMIQKLTLGTNVAALAFSCDCRSMLAATLNRIRIFDIASKKELRNLVGHSGNVTSLSLSSDGKMLASSGNAQKWDSSIRLWSEYEPEVESPQIAAFIESTIREASDKPPFKPPKSILSKTLREMGIADADSAKSTDKAIPSPQWDKLRTVKSFSLPNQHVCLLALSQDESRLIIANPSGKIRIFDFTTNKDVLVIETKIQISVMTLSQSGTLITGHMDGGIREWDINTGKEIRWLFGHLGQVMSLVSAAQDALLISGSADGTMRFWDMQSGKELRKIEAHEGNVNDIAVSPDLKTIISVGQDKKIRQWDPLTGKEIRRFKDTCRAGISKVIIHPNSRFAFTGCWDSSLRKWDIESGEEIKKIFLGTPQILKLSPDRGYIIAAMADKTIRILDVESLAQVRCISGFSGAIMSMAFSRNFSAFFTCGICKEWDQSIRLFAEADPPTEAYEVTQTISASLSATTIPSTERIDMSSMDWSKWKLKKKLEEGSNHLIKLLLSPNDQHLCTTSPTTLEIWNTEELASPKTIPYGPAGMPYGVGFSADGKKLVTGNQDWLLHEWNIADGKGLKVFTGHYDPANFVSWIGNDKLILSAGNDCTWRIWDTESGQEIRRIETFDVPVHYGAITPNNRQLVTFGPDAKLHIWDLAVGKEIGVYTAPYPHLRLLGISFEGNSIMLGGMDGLLRVVDIETAKEIQTIKIGINIFCGGFFPGGQFTACGCTDKTVRIWDIIKGKEVAKLEGHATQLISLVVASHGRLIISSGSMVPQGQFPMLAWSSE